MKRVMVLATTTLEQVVVVDLDDDDPDSAAGDYVRDEPSEYRLSTLDASIEIVGTWVVGAPCAMERSTSTPGRMWCPAHLSSAKEGEPQCYDRSQAEAIAGAGMV